MPLSTEGRPRWSPLLVCTSIATLLIAAQQIYSGVNDARRQAQSETRLLQGLLDQQGAPMDDRLLGLVAGRFEHILWARAAGATYRKTAGAPECDGAVDWWSTCVDGVESAAVGPLVVRYSLGTALASAARNLAFLLLIGAAGVIAWLASSRRSRRDDEAARAELRQAATRDDLTKLLNRPAFEQALNERMRAIADGAKPSALMVLDIDGLKHVNDDHGHATGDQLIEQVARRLEAAGPGVVLARLGGDEFGVLMGHGVGPAQAEAQAKRLLAAMVQPFEAEGLSATIGLSIGIALLDNRVTEGAEALRQADLAMHEVKRTGRGSFRQFDDRLGRDIRAHQRMLGDLRDGIRRRQFRLEYQPQVDAEGKLRGVEALLRWNHPHRGWIRPDEYVQLAEQSGLIVAIGDAVIEMACADLVHARKAGVHLPYVSVNVAPRQLVEPDFIHKLERTMTHFELGPRDLELEDTESSLISATEAAGTLMDRLSKRGFRLAIDDFGTGYSSLSRLVNLPVDKLKIDRSFINVFGTCQDSTVVAESVIALARKLRLKAVAEGVETAQQVQWLRAVGCELMQGFYFAKPMSMDHLIIWATVHLEDEAGDAPTWEDTVQVDIEATQLRGLGT